MGFTDPVQHELRQTHSDAYEGCLRQRAVHAHSHTDAVQLGMRCSHQDADKGSLYQCALHTHIHAYCYADACLHTALDLAS